MDTFACFSLVDLSYYSGLSQELRRVEEKLFFFPYHGIFCTFPSSTESGTGPGEEDRDELAQREETISPQPYRSPSSGGEGTVSMLRELLALSGFWSCKSIS